MRHLTDDIYGIEWDNDLGGNELLYVSGSIICTNKFTNIVFSQKKATEIPRTLLQSMFDKQTPPR